jgi:hypothetical protein
MEQWGSRTMSKNKLFTFATDTGGGESVFIDSV